MAGKFSWLGSCGLGFVRAFLLILWVASVADAAEGTDLRPDILFVLIDSLKASHLGCYGYGRNTTPNLDRFAATEGVRFETVIAGGSWTQPAVMTLFSSWTADRHLRVEPRKPHNPDIVTLAQALKSAGYQTVGITANAMTNRRFGYGKGFDVWDDYSATLSPDADEKQFGTGYANGAALTRMGLNRLKRRDSAKPLFLFLFYMDPHWDFLPPAPYDRMFSPDGVPPPKGIWRQKASEVPSAMRQRTVDAYDGEIAFCDHVLSNLFAEVKSMPRGKDTVIVVVGDHGEGFWEHGFASHGNDLHEEEIHVPLIIRPAVGDGSYVPGAVVRGQVGAIDIAPTVLDLVGVKSPSVWQGTSLKPLLKGGVSDGHPVVTETRISPRGGWMRAVRTDSWKIIARPPFEQPSEVYDLVADRAETNNLASAGWNPPDDVKALLPLLKPVQQERK